MRFGNDWVTGYRCALALALIGLSGCQPGGGTVMGWYLEHTQGLEVSRSIPGTVHAKVGGTQILAVTFAVNIRQIASSLTITEGLPLPSGWSGPSSFSCAKLQLDESCSLMITYAPTTAGSSTLALTYSYTDGAGNSHSDNLSIPYTSTGANNIVASVSPSGQINAVIGASAQTAQITFTTDDGQPATGFAITTDLASLPSGWNRSAGGFSCASVSSGSGCQLGLTYAPAAAASGTLNLTYNYTDDAGAAQSSSIDIPYASRATVGGNLSGLTGTVVLQNNAADNLSLSANGAFSFATALAAGAAYDVTVISQPSSLMQNALASQVKSHATISLGS